MSTIFLMAPAAYHRIAEHGEDSEEFYNLSGRMLLVAMFWLGLGIAADLWVILQKTAHSAAIAWSISAVTLLFFYGIWFGYSAHKRREKVRERLAS
jgi:cbb3-type cytochrome oxidase subunit 3